MAAWDDDLDSDSDALASVMSGADAPAKPARSSSHTLSDAGYVAASSISQEPQPPRRPSTRGVEEEDLLDISGLSVSSPTPPQDDAISSRTRSKLKSDGLVDLVTDAAGMVCGFAELFAIFHF